jgi:hypothetical protein
VCVCVTCLHSARNVLRRILQQLNETQATGTGQYPYQLVRMNVSISSCAGHGSPSPALEGHATERAVKHWEGTEPLKIPVELLRYQ